MRVPDSISIPSEIWQAMHSHVLGSLPEEACGLLAGRGERVSRAFAVENAEHSAVRYRMVPEAQLAALMEIEAAGLDLLAIYHSHPAGPTGVSATDRAEAAYPEAVQLIWSPTGEGWRLAGFDLSGPEPRPVQVIIV